MVITPAIGVPSEVVLQDTLKSCLVVVFSIAAALAFTWDIRSKTAIIYFHNVFWLPVSLAIFATFSAYWAHAYLAYVEAIRWLIFSLLFLIGSNTLTQKRVSRTVWGIHVGAVLATLWAVTQFWTGFSIFPQGPNPASTFVNRNFYAEYLICTIPFSVYLLTIARNKAWLVFLSVTLGLNLVGLSMTGTRSALVVLLFVSILISAALWTNRRYFLLDGWNARATFFALTLTIATVAWLGSIPTNNRKLIAEFGATTALDRGLSRVISTMEAKEYSEGSFSVRLDLWKTTLSMIVANRAMGVGAGSWEVQAPLFQNPGREVEADYYAHNEILQLVAEYGVLGWLFLIALSTYIGRAIVRTVLLPKAQFGSEIHLRYFSLISLLGLLLVSCAGFPWRMATTGALFALGLSILAASDMRIGFKPFGIGYVIKLKKSWVYISLWILSLVFTLALYISEQAFAAESSLIRGIKWIAMATMSGNPDDALGLELKAKGLSLVRTGIDINPHYRKLTPIAADLLAAAGDWENALWIWESTLESRPNVTAIISNIANAHLKIGNASKAQHYLDRALALQPGSSTLKTLQEQIWLTTEQDKVGQETHLPPDSLRK